MTCCNLNLIQRMDDIRKLFSLRGLRLALKKGNRRSGFTLVELLAVIGIMLVMLSLAVVAFNSLKAAGDFARSVDSIAGLLDQGRTYAMANNTYVYVGLAEVDSSISESTTPQVNTANGGRIAVGIIATKDGTRDYNVNATFSSSGASFWSPSYGTGASFVNVGKIAVFQNIHIAAIAANTGGMQRPTATITAVTATLPSFSLPLGNGLTSGYKYKFTKVIQFDPQGMAHYETAVPYGTVPAVIEIGLQQSKGKITTFSSSAPIQVAAIQIQGITGQIKVYRP